MSTYKQKKCKIGKGIWPKELAAYSHLLFFV